MPVHGLERVRVGAESSIEKAPRLPRRRAFPVALASRRSEHASGRGTPIHPEELVARHAGVILRVTSAATWRKGHARVPRHTFTLAQVPGTSHFDLGFRFAAPPGMFTTTTRSLLLAFLFVAPCGIACCSSSEGAFTIRPATLTRPQANRCTSPRPSGRPGSRPTDRTDAGDAMTDSGSSMDGGSEPVVPAPVGASCTTDADCVAGQDARCSRHIHGGGVAMEVQHCTYSACAEDSDCGPNAICMCDDIEGHRCEAAGCRIDADCKDRLGCSPSSAGYQCHTTNDECIDPSDCPSQGGTMRTCDFDKRRGRWSCVGIAPDAAAGVSP